MTRYSRGVLKENYHKATVVGITECIKFAFSALMIHLRMEESRRKMDGDRQTSFLTKITELVSSGTELAVPAFIYFIQNQLGFVALTGLAAGTFSLINQLKVLTTAVFAVLILNSQLSSRKWRALFLLVLGVALIQVNPNVIESEDDEENSFTGMVAAFVQVLLSGLAGIYFEKVLKKNGAKKADVWEKNLQLAFYSIMFGMLNLLMDWGTIVGNGGFFGGWSRITACVAIVNATGGFLVAFSVKHTNTIIKGFAGSGAIVLSSILGHYMFGDILDAIFAIGAGCVILSIFNYSEVDPKPENLLPILEPKAKSAS